MKVRKIVPFIFYDKKVISKFASFATVTINEILGEINKRNRIDI